MLGKIDSYEKNKGFGYIKSNDGEMVFLHITGIIQGDPKTIEIGQEVQFVIAAGVKGPQAAKVKLSNFE